MWRIDLFIGRWSIDFQIIERDSIERENLENKYGETSTENENIKKSNSGYEFLIYLDKERTVI